MSTPDCKGCQNASFCDGKGCTPITPEEDKYSFITKHRRDLNLGPIYWCAKCNLWHLEGSVIKCEQCGRVLCRIHQHHLAVPYVPTPHENTKMRCQWCARTYADTDLVREVSRIRLQHPVPQTAVFEFRDNPKAFKYMGDYIDRPVFLNYATKPHGLPAYWVKIREDRPAVPLAALKCSVYFWAAVWARWHEPVVPKIKEGWRVTWDIVDGSKYIRDGQRFEEHLKDKEKGLHLLGVRLGASILKTTMYS